MKEFGKRLGELEDLECEMEAVVGEKKGEWRLELMNWLKQFQS